MAAARLVHGTLEVVSVHKLIDHDTAARPDGLHDGHLAGSLSDLHGNLTRDLKSRLTYQRRRTLG